ncbi:hypothetical protein DIURU_001353 [Diutina rugosa]|uniref:AMP deaminase n=1 Tax=Diutina rugosa TaxID=5481 RepID=A0A642UUS2_DIURU|nr:uncharacterized protein DIURU_001353 [Diutina rugosa]KAA8905817.1 hypothetical protein DIURU_001353 [Diutina rugosa]
MCSSHEREQESAVISSDEVFTEQEAVPYDEDDTTAQHIFVADDDEADGVLDHGGVHYSTAQERVMKEYELKLKAMEALHIDEAQGPEVAKAARSNSIKRRQSFIDMPDSNLPSRLRYHAAIDAAQTSEHINALPEDYPSDELIELFANVSQCLELRHKYLKSSVQFDEMKNPKNQPGWEIYPPPRPPAYKDQKDLDTEAKREWRQKNQFDFSKCEIPDDDERFEFGMSDEGVYRATFEGKQLEQVPSLNSYYRDLNTIISQSSDGPSKSFAFKRMEYLEARWNLYYLLNDFEEVKQSKKNPHRDFYNVRKVDTHIHHSACMNQKHLLRFIKHKLKTCPDEKVIYRDGHVLTLSQVFDSLNLTAYDLSIDTLDMHAHTDTFHRFDKFNLKYNPIGESRLREIFLKTDNYINGRYLAELTREVFADLENSKYQMSELRISIYGRSIEEWDKLAAWVVDNKLFSDNVRWLIQVPRLYDVYKKNQQVESFGEIITNIFLPLYEVSKNPKSHPKLHVFLERVVGFDSVDDESKSETVMKRFPIAPLWTNRHNPPYSYYLYYLYANLVSLNQIRLKRKQNTFVLRPHCGEAGDPEHLIAAFLTSHSISHGILLRKIPYMQYVYYLDQIGLAMSPLSNNALFLTYDKNPFYNFFKKGLNVSLSTDDPLQFSYTKEPLIEEYSVAAQIYKLSGVDMCELAANSVKQSGWEAQIKAHWLGKNWWRGGVEGNDVEKTNVPDIRVCYREETLKNELDLVRYYASLKK